MGSWRYCSTHQIESAPLASDDAAFGVGHQHRSLPQAVSDLEVVSTRQNDLAPERRLLIHSLRRDAVAQAVRSIRSEYTEKADDLDADCD